jgi:hypothetical protein
LKDVFLFFLMGPFWFILLYMRIAATQKNTPKDNTNDR